MVLDRISIMNFKNIEQQTLSFTARINCFVGDNGAGKTNILDAIYYLSMSKSAMMMTDRQSLRHEADFFLLEGEYRCDNGSFERVYCGFKPQSGKILKRNNKEYERLAEHIGLIPIVMVSPGDSLLISDAADGRRKYINSLISQFDSEYLVAIMRYNHILAERNKLLKMESIATLLEVLNEQLVHWGEIVHQKRKEVIERLTPIVGEFYSILSGDKEQVELSYTSSLNDKSMIELLNNNIERDRINQHTTAGVHRDDLKMKIGGYPLRKYGSQGQQKSFLIALKLAQYVIVSQQKGDKPLLLLDDLFDKLDLKRVEQLLELVGGDSFGQIFITDCNKMRLESILKNSSTEYSLWSVANGVVNKG